MSEENHKKMINLEKDLNIIKLISKHKKDKPLKNEYSVNYLEKIDILVGKFDEFQKEYDIYKESITENLKSHDEIIERIINIIDTDFSDT